MRPNTRWRATLETNPPLPRLSPAPKPVTQINRLTRASCIAVTSTWVAFEKSRVDSKMISGPAETPSDWATAFDAGQRAFHRSHLERVAGNFFEFGVTNKYSSGRPRQGTNPMSRFEGGLQGLKANPSAGADDQNCRHARQCSCRTGHSSSCAI